MWNRWAGYAMRVELAVMGIALATCPNCYSCSIGHQEADAS